MADRWLLPTFREIGGLVSRCATARIDSGSMRNAQAEVAQDAARSRERAHPWPAAYPPPTAQTDPPRAVGAP